MAELAGRISCIQVYEEEGRTDWALALSKLCWFAICVLFPISLFRFVKDLFNPVLAGISVLIMLLVIRLLGPLNLVMLDELLVRIVPTLRSAMRLGTVRIYDFRIEQEEGRQIACILRGDLRGGAPMEGDSVLLEGVYRGGVFRVSTGRNRTTNSLLAPRPRYSNWILLCTAGLVLLFALYLRGTFDAWIYPFFAHLFKLFGQKPQAGALLDKAASFYRQ